MEEHELPDPSRQTILVIEDDDAIGEFITLGIIQSTPFHALRVANAIEALEATNMLRPDLIVLDYHLPGINGLELYEKFQENEQLKGIPMLMMSADLPEHFKQTLPITFLEKPFSLDEFLGALEQLLAG